MAGRSGSYINSKDETREYDYTGPQKGKPAGQLGKRKHKIRNQGRRMIQKIGNKASRYAYPGAEAKLPEARLEMQAAVYKSVDSLNKMLRSR
jgi:hypothetical protein